MRNSKDTIGRKVPLTNFLAEYQAIKGGIDEAILRVLESGWFILGPEVEKFEREMANYVGTKFAVGVASGTDALTLSLKALGIKKEDGVIIPANVYPTAFGVSLSGAKLQLADVDPNTLNVSAKTLRDGIDRSTKVIVVVHLYGNPVDIRPIAELAKKRRLYLIEDCAQAAGAEYKNRKVGTFGDVSCFSFYPTKNLGAYGDGGAVLTNNRDLAEKVRLWRMYGERERYKSILRGHNSRLDELQAAILGVKLQHLDKWNKKRRQLASFYLRQLKDLPITMVQETEGGKSVYHMFVIQTEDRDKLARYLKAQGVGTGIHYPTPIHTTLSFLDLGHKEGDFPISEKASKSVLSLPVNPQMSQSDVRYVTSCIKDFFDAYRLAVCK